MFKEKFLIVKVQIFDGQELNLYWIGHNDTAVAWTTKKLEAIQKGYFHSYIDCVNHINLHFAPGSDANKLNHLEDAYQIEKYFVHEPVV